MGDAPKLTAAEYGYLRSLTEEIRLDMMKVHHLCDFSHGLDYITPKGRAALEAYDAEQRRAIRVEAMHECILAATAVKAAAEADGDEDDDVFDLAQERAYGAKLVLRAIADLIAKEESNG